MAKSKWGRSTPYTRADAVSMYKSNADFRKIANNASAALAGLGYTATSQSIDMGSKLAESAADASTKMADVLAGTTAEAKFYYHPALVLEWIRWLASRDGDRVLDKFDAGKTPGPAVLVAMMNAWKEPPEFARMWNSIAKTLGDRAGKVPYLNKNRVHLHKVTGAANKQVAGFRLMFIDLLVPYGAQARKQPGDGAKAYFTPERMVRVRLDLTTDAARRLFGELWIATDKTGKNLALVPVGKSGKNPKVKADFLKLLLGNSKTTNLGSIDVPMSPEDRKAVRLQPVRAMEEELARATTAAQRESVAAASYAVVDRTA